jgi:hypothetical protein
MRSRLFVFGCFADDPQGVLAAVHNFAHVGIKLRSDRNLGICPQFCGKLRIAPFANSEGGDARDSLHDTKHLGIWHEASLTEAARRT